MSQVLGLKDILNILLNVQNRLRHFAALPTQSGPQDLLQTILQNSS